MGRLTTNYYGCNQIIDCENEMCYETCDKYKDCTECPIKKAIDRLAEYEDADEAGLLFRLPCKPGDILYYLDKRSGNITPKKVLRMDITVTATTAATRGRYMTITFENSGYCLEQQFGKSVFLNKADALHAFEEYQSRGKT